MIRSLLLIVLLSGCADKQPRVAWLEVAGLDGGLRVEEHDGDAVAVGGHLLISRTRSQISFRFRREEPGLFEIMRDRHVTPVRIVAQPSLRAPRLGIARSRRRGALLVEIERRRGEDAWTMYIGRPPLAEAVACGTLEGSWLRCE